MATWTCDRCGASNGAPGRICERCGERRPETEVFTTPAVCVADGMSLMANGYCERGEGFPLARPCPFVCPRCRQRLTWEGTCLHCPASEGAPGDRYELHAGHWVLVQRGPQPLCGQEANRQAAELVRDVLARRRAVAEAQAVLGAALGGPPALAARQGEPRGHPGEVRS